MAFAVVRHGGDPWGALARFRGAVEGRKEAEAARKKAAKHRLQAAKARREARRLDEKADEDEAWIKARGA